MSAPFSTSSLANSLNLRISTPAARNAVLGIDGIGATSDSFSRTLQNQMNAGGNASTRNESAPSPATPMTPSVSSAMAVTRRTTSTLWELTVSSSGTSTTTGNVVTYEGRTYWVSGERVAETSLGAPVATGVLYQGTTADLREVRGFPADQVLAAYIPAQRAGQTGSGWTFAKLTIANGQIRQVAGAL